MFTDSTLSGVCWFLKRRGYVVLQLKGLVPDGVEAAFDGLGLLFALAAWIWDQFELHVGV